MVRVNRRKKCGIFNVRLLVSVRPDSYEEPRSYQHHKTDEIMPEEEIGTEFRDVGLLTSLSETVGLDSLCVKSGFQL